MKLRFKGVSVQCLVFRCQQLLPKMLLHLTPDIGALAFGTAQSSITCLSTSPKDANLTPKLLSSICLAALSARGICLCETSFCLSQTCPTSRDKLFPVEAGGPQSSQRASLSTPIDVLPVASPYTAYDGDWQSKAKHSSIIMCLFCRNNETLHSPLLVNVYAL